MTDPTPKPDGESSRAPDQSGAPARRLVDLPPSGPAASRPIAAPPVGHRERRTRNVGWRSRDVIRAAALVFALYVLGQLLWFASSLVFVVFLGTLFGLAVGAAVDRVERLGFRRRGVASALVVFGTLGILVGTGALMAPTLSEQFGVLRRQIPAALDRAQRWVETHPNSPIAMAAKSLTGPAGAPAGATPAGATPPTGAATGTTPSPARGTAAATDARTQQIADRAVQQAAQRTSAEGGDSGAPSATQTLAAKLGGQLSRASGYLFGFLSSVGTVTAGLVLIIFLAIYIGAEPRLYHDGLMHLFPHRTRRRAGEVLTEMATVLRKWLVVQLIAMLTIGTVTTIAMLLLNVKAAFALGFIAGLLEFIPTVGPILSAVPAIAMGFVDGPEKALVVVFAYWGIQFLENNLLIPALMRGGMDIPPALTLVAQALMTLVFGFLGLMVAVPLTAAIMVPIKMLYVRDVVGDDMPLMSDNSGDDDEEDEDD
ncbi:MAG: AI-2E family transporter [Gemmatirosa sp.]